MPTESNRSTAPEARHGAKGLAAIARRMIASVPALLAALLVAAWWYSVPEPLFDEPYSPAVYDTGGNLLSARVAADEQWRFEPAKALSERFVTALLAFEDKRYFRHPGVDPLALARAMRDNIRAGAVVSGGSTITMQVARMALGNEDRTLGNKLLETLAALRLSVSHSKPDILSLYAAHAPFGGNIVGVEAAALRYFGRAPAELSWAEASLLAVLPNNPSLLRLDRGREALLAKRDALLEKLSEQGLIGSDTLAVALTEPLPGAPGPIPQAAPHLLARAGSGGGSRLVTVQEELQRRSGQVLGNHRERLANLGAGNAAAVIIDVERMEIIAYHGNFPGGDGGSFGRSAALGPVSAEYVDHAAALRSTGSLLKPFLFAAMVDAGELLPTQLVPDIPTFIGSYRPQNHTRDYLGAVTATQALSDSLNVPTARMLRDYGVVRFYNILRELGIDSLHRPPAEYGITLILGGAEASLLALTTEYAQAAWSVRRESDAAPEPQLWRGGASGDVRGDAAGFAADAGGAPADSAAPTAAGTSAAPAARRSPIGYQAWWVTLKALEDVTRPGIDAMWRDLESLPAVSWKTGTSYGLRDAWAIGVTSDVAIGVWAGNSDGHGAAGLRGSDAAGPLLFDLLHLFPDAGGFRQPGGLIPLEVCAESGFPAVPACSERRWVMVPEAAEAAPSTPYDRYVHLDESGRYRADMRCAEEAGLRVEGRMVLPPAMEWFYQKRHASYSPLPPVHPACGDLAAGGRRYSASSSSGSQLGLEYPREGNAVYVPVDFGGAKSQVVFQAYHRDRRARLFWHLDRRYLGETVEIHQIEARPANGEHLLTVVDDLGNRDSVRFTVLSE